jgi:hypothetical protein
MSKNSDDREFTRFLYRAYLVDGDTVHTGEALLLACLMHTTGKSRKSDHMADVQRIMKDRNVQTKKNN